MLYFLQIEGKTLHHQQQQKNHNLIYCSTHLIAALTYRGNLELSPQYLQGLPVHARLLGASLSLGAAGPRGGICSLLQVKFHDTRASKSREQKWWNSYMIKH